jgi:hypothetical protein
MAEKIFWDTWAFLALAEREYRLHETAKAIRYRLEQDKSLLVTTEAVLTEVANSLARPQLRKLAHEQVAYATGMARIGRGEIVAVDERLWRRAWELYQNRPDKAWGHTDCISFVVMQDLGLTQAFTADRHFEQAGFVRLVAGI